MPIKKVKRLKITCVDTQMPYNEQFIKILGEIESIMMRRGEQFRARAYHKAAETIMACTIDITDPAQLVGKPNIGETIMSKLKEYVDTGKVGIIEEKKNDPLNILTKVFGIGPKKAQEMINDGIDTLDKLRANQTLLTAAQKIGLEFFDDIESTIPRREIDKFEKVFKDVFIEAAPPGSKFEIVGSYRRGKQVSGDIDIIITNTNHNKDTFDDVFNELVKCKLVTHILSRGKTKSLTLAKMPGCPYRRVDLLYSPPDEYAFATLYFTGSKAFNTVQRQRANDIGYTLNEHGIYEMVGGNKGNKLKAAGEFLTEQSIFDFLQMEYKEPCERIDGRSVIIVEPPIFKKSKNTYVDSLSEKELVCLIHKANLAYYVKGEPVMSDEQYDSLIDYAKSKYPKNKQILSGHTSIDVSSNVSKTKVVLPYEMWSMDKIKPDTCELTKWTTKYKGPYVLTCKLDGVSCLYVSPDKLYTRGNGKIGQDVSGMLPYLRLPKEDGIVIRGELIIKKELFQEKYSKEFSNPRNFVAGVVNQKMPHTDRLSSISFVAYELIQPIVKQSKQLKLLGAMDVETVHSDMIGTLSSEILSNMLESWKTISAYEMDGLICCNDAVYSRRSGNPEHAFAFKTMSAENTIDTRVVSVLWAASKDGYLKPRVQFEPVVLGGVRIEYATGFNGKFIVDNNIGIGAVVTIIRSGDVIPHIVNVVTPAKEPLMPSDEYVWNETGIDIILVNKMNDLDVNHKIVTLFFKTIGVDGLGSGNLKKIIEAGYNTIPLIISMTREQYLDIPGFKQKMSDKIYDGIKAKLNEASLPLLMDATNVFGRGFGEKKFQSILADLPDIIVSTNSVSEKIALVEKVNGIAFKTAQRFVENLPTFIAWATLVGVESKLFAKPVIKHPGSKQHPLYGKKIVITGFRDKEFVAALERVGAINASNVSKDVCLVIVKETGVDTSKTELAKANGIPITTLPLFKKKFAFD